MARQTVTIEGAFPKETRDKINDNFTELYAGGSGQTIASPTITSPTITGTTTIGAGATITSPALVTPALGVAASGTIPEATVINSDGKALAATATYTSTVTPATLTGFAWVLAAGTYIFEMELATTMTTNGGLNLNFLLTTAVLTSIRYNTYAATASDNTTAVSTTGTTTASGTNVFSSKAAAYTHLRVWGSMVVGTGGTFTWQGAQETSAGGGDVTSVLIASFAKMQRVA